MDRNVPGIAGGAEWVGAVSHESSWNEYDLCFTLHTAVDESEQLVQGKDVRQVSIEAIRPDVRAIDRIDEQPRDPNAIARFAYAAFQDITHTEFSADPLDADGLTLVVKPKLRAMTKTDLKRDCAVTMSSTSPPTKYSCSGSPLIF